MESVMYAAQGKHFSARLKSGPHDVPHFADKENECMRVYMEPLMYAAGVDLMLYGHVHAVRPRVRNPQPRATPDSALITHREHQQTLPASCYPHQYSATTLIYSPI